MRLSGSVVHLNRETFVCTAQSKVASPVTSGLPVGWEKKLDHSTGRYYFIDHNTKKTHWTPPAVVRPSGSPGHVYKAKLKDEGSGSGNSGGGGGGLKRSHSSPNIAKLVEEEGRGALPQATPQPLPNRASKPRLVWQQGDVYGFRD